MANHVESPWNVPEEIEIIEGAGEGNILYPDFYEINDDTLNCRFISTDHENNFLGLEGEFISENKFSQDGETYTIQFTRPGREDYLAMQFMIVDGIPTVSLFDDIISVKLNISADMYGKMIDYIIDNLGDPAAVPVPEAPVQPVAPVVPAEPAAPEVPVPNPNNEPFEPNMPAPGPNGRKRKSKGKSKRRGSKNQRKTRRHQRKY